MKKTTILVLSALLSYLASQGAQETKHRPKILFIAIDDMSDWNGKTWRTILNTLRRGASMLPSAKCSRNSFP